MVRCPLPPPRGRSDLGLEPHLLSDGLIDSLLTFAVDVRQQGRGRGRGRGGNTAPSAPGVTVCTHAPPCPPPQYKDRVNRELIKPAVDWRKSPVTVATGSAAVAKQ